MTVVWFADTGQACYKERHENGGLALLSSALCGRFRGCKKLESVLKGTANAEGLNLISPKKFMKADGSGH